MSLRDFCLIMENSTSRTSDALLIIILRSLHLQSRSSLFLAHSYTVCSDLVSLFYLDYHSNSTVILNDVRTHSNIRPRVLLRTGLSDSDSEKNVQMILPQILLMAASIGSGEAHSKGGFGLQAEGVLDVLPMEGEAVEKEAVEKEAVPPPPVFRNFNEAPPSSWRSRCRRSRIRAYNKQVIMWNGGRRNSSGRMQQVVVRNSLCRGFCNELCRGGGGGGGGRGGGGMRGWATSWGMDAPNK